jgi:putative inorganic carbon (hco3(-)) transporter
VRDFLVIGIVILCGLIAIRRPVFGILSYIGLGILSPHSMAWTIGKTFPFAQVIGFGTILGYLLWSEPKRLPIQRESVLLIALWAMFCFSTIFAAFPDRAFDRLIYVSKVVLMVFLCTSIINTEQRLLWLARVISLSMGFYGLKGGVFSVATAGKYLVWGPEQSYLFANNSIGLALAMNIPLLFYLAKMEENTWLRRVMRLMLIFSYPAIICTFSRGAWVGMTVATILILFRSRKTLALAAAFGIIAIFAASFAPEKIPERVVSRYGDLINYEEETSAQSRLWNWEGCKRVGLANPLVGAGFDFYSIEVYEKYFPEFLDQWPGKVWSCHGIWHTIFSEHGFIGLVVWIGLIFACFGSLRRLSISQNNQSGMSWAKNYVDMLGAALVVFLVVGTFLDAAYFELFYYLVAMVIILKGICDQSGRGDLKRLRAFE